MPPGCGIVAEDFFGARLREAEIEGGELTVNAFAIMGGANVYVPDSVETELGGFSIMGGNTEFGSARSPRPGAPTPR